MKRSILSLALILAVILSSFMPSLVYAGTNEDKTVAGEGGVTCGSYSAGNWSIMNDGNDAAYLISDAPWTSPCNHTYNMTDFSTSHTAINSVTGSARIRLGDSGGTYSNGASYIICRVSGTVYTGSIISPTMSFVTYTYTWNTNPATGTAWTQTTLNAAEFGVQLGDAAVWLGGGSWDYYPHRCSEFKITVNYNPPVLPTVTSTSPTTYTDTTATLIGTITDDGSDTITNYGFVWDTSDKGDPGNSAPADGIGGWTKGWTIGAGTYSEATYTHAITGLTKNTTYYIRFAALNSVGWEYSTAVTFKTIADPTISTSSASNVGSTTATLNANLTDDGKVGGGEDCTVTFIYKAGTYANYAAILAAGGTETAASGTWNTGEFPSLNIASLAVSTTYSFSVKAVNITATAAYGTALTFATDSGVYLPTNLVAIPDSATCSLSWVRGIGAPTTLVKYKTGTYPVITTEGTTAYLGNSNSVSVTGLIPGTTYYVSAWGNDAGVYSGTYATVMFTTLAASTSTTTNIEVPPAYSPWNQTPSDTKISTWPIIGTMLQNNSSAYGTPVNWMAYLGCIIVATIVGIVTYSRGGNNSVLAAAAALVLLGISAIAFELVMLWIVVFLLIIYCGWTLFGERR